MKLAGQILVVVVAVLGSGIFMALIVLLALWILKGMKRFGGATISQQSRLYEDVVVYDGPGPGLVHVVFHTYSGILFFAHQAEHRFWASPQDARTLLSRLHWFNLKWGIFAQGGILVPPLSLGNYWAQRRSIAKQEAAMPPAERIGAIIDSQKRKG